MSSARVTPLLSRQPRHGRMVAALTTLLVLAGCASQIPRPPSPTAEQSADLHTSHAAALREFGRWRLAGRIAVQREDKGFSADLDWREAAPDFSLRVAAPLNGGTFALNGNAAGVVLVSPKGETYSAPDAETLMRQHLGWALPLAGARYWVRGLPTPDHPVSGERLDEQGRWTDFAQDGWRVSILEYTAAAGLDLPKRLFMSHDQLQVRMAIKSWERR